MNFLDIPRDSVLAEWVRQYRQTEVPVNFLVTVGLSCLGMMLRRDVWVRHMSESTLIYPNLSVILIGHSGCGKDTCINFGRQWLHSMGLSDLLIGGRTIEGVYQQLVDRGDPAIGFLPLGELTAVVGTKDYQQGIIQGLTDLMSGNPVVNVSTRSNPKALIHNPTLTVHAGSTIEWLHKAMPDGALEGGFLGRFLLAIRAPSERANYHPLPAYEYVDLEERAVLRDAAIHARNGAHKIMVDCKGRGNILIAQDAQDLYNNWYFNRFQYFSSVVMPYANRCRDTVLKIALISAMSRHRRWIDCTDIQLGIKVLADAASKIDAVVTPPTREGQAAAAIMAMLPATRYEILKTVKDRFYYREISTALQLLEESHEVVRHGEKFCRA